MKRFEDWPERLARFIDAHQGTPFAWGENDCCLFAANAILAMTGIDLAEGLRGYSTHTGALRIIAPFGDLETLAAGIAEEAGLEEIQPKLAQRGDLIFAEHQGMAIVGMNGIPLCPSSNGLVGVKGRLRAWRV
jgi:hypothetical protein